MGLVLLLEALFKELLERLQVEVLERGGQQPAFFGGEAGHVERVREPVPDVVVDLHRRLDALEHGRERLVVLVEVRLRLDEDAARDGVELVEPGGHEPHGEPAHEGQPLRDRDRHPVEAEQEEEVGEHRPIRASALGHDLAQHQSGHHDGHHDDDEELDSSDAHSGPLALIVRPA
jgi:hypothetical protein